jgi:hypothetical protein
MLTSFSSGEHGAGMFTTRQHCYEHQVSSAYSLLVLHRAMKFVPLLGEILKNLALTGTTQHNISNFKITRQGVLKGKVSSALLSRDVAGTAQARSGSSQHRAYIGGHGH